MTENIENNDSVQDQVSNQVDDSGVTNPPAPPKHDVQVGGLMFKAESVMLKGTVEYELELGFGPQGKEEKPVLFVLPATERNKPFYNEELKLKAAKRKKEFAAKRKKSGKRSNVDPLSLLGGEPETADEIEQLRLRDRDLFAKYVVKGWKQPRMEDGVEVRTGILMSAGGEVIPDTPENIHSFLTALIEIDFEVFDALCNWCRDPANFRSDSDLDEEDQAELKNE